MTTDSQGRVRIADADGSVTTASWFDTLIIEGYGANAWLSGARGGCDGGHSGGRV